MNIGTALHYLKQRAIVGRAIWRGKQYIELQVPDAHSKRTEPYVFVTTALGERFPWICSQQDLLADDWRVVGYAEGMNPFPLNAPQPAVTLN